MIRAPHSNFQMIQTEADGRREELLRRARRIASDFGERVHKLLGKDEIDGQPSDSTQDKRRTCTD